MNSFARKSRLSLEKRRNWIRKWSINFQGIYWPKFIERFLPANWIRGVNFNSPCHILLWSLFLYLFAKIRTPKAIAWKGGREEGKVRAHGDQLLLVNIGHFLKTPQAPNSQREVVKIFSDIISYFDLYPKFWMACWNRCHDNCFKSCKK